MSNYDEFAEWERQQANVKAGRSSGNNGTFQEALNNPRYKGDGAPVEIQPESTIYQDEQGKRFRYIFGQRVYLNE